MKPIKNLIIEKINPSFIATTQTSQVSGLGPCLSMIADAVEGSFKITVNNYTHLVIAARRHSTKNIIMGSMFLTQDELKRLKTEFPNRQLFIMVHSNMPFLAVETDMWFRILQAKELGYTIIFNDDRMILEGSKYLPNIYTKKFRDIKPRQSGEVVKVICGGSLRHLKNHATQAIGAMHYADKHGKKLEFYIHGRSEAGRGLEYFIKTLFNNTQHSLKKMPWLDHDAFIDSLEEYDFGLQVSLTESFNITAADYVAAGLPMVVSNDIRWADNSVKADCGDPRDISKKMETASDWLDKSRLNLLKHTEKAIELWKQL